MTPLRIDPIDRPGPALDAVYRDLLAPHFPADELDTLEDIESGLLDGTTSVLAAADDGGLLGVAVGDWVADQRVQLLSYLAVDPERRSGGVGGRLLDAALDRWAAQYRPCVIVAELEHPGQAAVQAAWGDPRRRYDFYGRHGARVLDLPFFQPALRAGAERVYGMLLIVLRADESLLADPDHVAAGPVGGFLRDYFLSTEGRIPEDPAAEALLAPASDPAGVPMLDPKTTPLGLLPRSTAPSGR